MAQNEVRLLIQEGSAKVGSAYTEAETEGIVLLYISLDTKYCDIVATSSGQNPGISLQRSDARVEEPFTEITFADYGPNWEVFSATTYKYGCSVVLYNKLRQENANIPSKVYFSDIPGRGN